MEASHRAVVSAQTHTTSFQMKGHVHVQHLSLPHSPCRLDPLVYPALRPLHPSFHVSADAVAAGALLIKPVDTRHEVMNRTRRYGELPRFQAIPEDIALYSPELAARWMAKRKHPTAGKECALKSEKSVSLTHHLHVSLGNLMVLQDEFTKLDSAWGQLIIVSTLPSIPSPAMFSL